jgi:regulator of RNase E activity RraA
MADLPTTTLADVLDRRQVMDSAIRPLWSPAPRIAGPAFTVRCPPGDNLMLHAAIYRAEPGSVIVVESGDLDYALAGGNVCAVAKRNGVAGFVLDGLIRDIGEIREMGFPVWGRGVIPIPGGKAAALPLNVPIRCGGVAVQAGDFVVADDDGVVVVPLDGQGEALAAAEAKLAADAALTLDDWEHAHRAKIDGLLAPWQGDQA